MADWYPLLCWCSAVSSTLFGPVCGHLSDVWYTRWGRRKPFMVVGLLGSCAFKLSTSFAGDAEGAPGAY